MTPYTPGPKDAPGSCGIGADDSQDVVAISHVYFKGKNGNGNPHCGKKVRVKYHGKTVELKIIDLCNACGEHDLDIAIKPFQKLSGVKDGKHGGVNWEFL
ncbi:Papain inhibitor [Pseudocercospora fuligena]|uniref:Papain inhibitor n=1 Tax=Pseudocercospora fuligena TaxID=685502 RepID=A0A8H6RKM8_9PEZI|nr:Papain inhibitor [Pseudocercospora fuligena]